jgi:hypothetical protein
MKYLAFVALILLFIGCHTPDEPLKQPDAYRLSVNPSVDTTQQLNQQIFLALKSFLSTKNENARANPYWLAEDFEKYPYPYYDVFQLENGPSGPNTFLPTLLAIHPSATKNGQIVKIGFMGSPDHSNTYLKAVYNMLALQINDQIYFKRILEYNTRNWETRQWGPITYYISPRKSFSPDEARELGLFIEKLCAFFDTPPIPLQYYSCMNPEELLQIRGFDFKPEMYVAENGGQNEVWSGIIYSGNGSEKYEHEVVHSYLYELSRLQQHPLFDEGLATYLGGSAQLPYTTHREYVKDYIATQPELDLREHLNPYDAVKIKEYTSLPYVIGGLICEYAYRYYGKDSLLQLFQSGKTDDNLWIALEAIGLHKENFNEQLRELLQEETVLIFN